MKIIDNSNLINTVKKLKGSEWGRPWICVVHHVCGLQEAFHTFILVFLNVANVKILLDIAALTILTRVGGWVCLKSPRSSQNRGVFLSLFMFLEFVLIF